MKTVIAIAAFVISTLANSFAAAAPFINLNFEQATVVHSSGFIDWSAAMPGWQAVPPTTILHYGSGHLSFGLQRVLTDLFHPDNPNTGFPYALNGRFSVYLSRGGNWTTGETYHSIISQTGDIPQQARSIQMLTDSFTPPKVTVGGETIPMVVLETIKAPATVNEVYPWVPLGMGIAFRYGGDISDFAGTTAELTIADSGLLDDITFSAQTVPEPRSVTLALFSFLAMMCLRCRRPTARFCHRPEHQSSLLAKCM